MTRYSGNPLNKIKNNSEANKIAKENGYNNAEDLKDDYVPNNGAKFNMHRNTETGEIILVNIKDSSIKIYTGLFG